LAARLIKIRVNSSHNKTLRVQTISAAAGLLCLSFSSYAHICLTYRDVHDFKKKW
jgi:hypothetical protein